MLGQPISMLIPEVIGFRFTGALREGVTATDLVLTVTQMLRKKGVVGKFVEYSGHGLDSLSLEDRATMANMAPEYGATCGFFPADKDMIDYLRSTAAIRTAWLWWKPTPKRRECGATRLGGPGFHSALELDLSTVEPSLRPAPPAGPRAACPRGGRL